MTRYESLLMLISNPGDDCILWPSTWATTKGYGTLWVPHARRSMKAPTAALMSVSDRPAGFDAAHGPCNNRLCVNPLHLSWKDRSSNILDKKRDGTFNPPPTRRKLSASDIDDIRSAHGTHAEIADRYGVARSTVTNIIGRRGCYA